MLLELDTSPTTPALALPQVAAPRMPFQLALITTKLPLVREATPLAPTESPLREELPTRLFVEERAPKAPRMVLPVVPSSQVAAPALLPLPLSQLGLTKTKLPPVRAVMTVLPTKSLGVLPVMLLVELTAPVMPLVPLPQVTAPTVPQSWLWTT